VGGSGDAPPIGVALGTVGATADWWLESARQVEAAGYRALWAWDLFVGKGDPTVPVQEQWTILSAAAGATSRIRLGTFISNVMNRHPALLARMASTLQAASGGRLTLGLGIGAGLREHRAYGMPFPEADERARRLDDAIGVIRAVWTGGPITRPSPFFPLEGAHAFPPPSPPPQILVGASSPAGVRLAARLGDGWAAESPLFERLRQAYLDALAAEGRSLDDVRVVVGFGHGRTGEDLLPGSPWVEAPREAWAAYAELGASEVVVTARTRHDVDLLLAAAERW